MKLQAHANLTWFALSNPFQMFRLTLIGIFF